MKRAIIATLALAAAAFLSTMAHGQEIALRLPAGASNIVAHDEPATVLAREAVTRLVTVPLMLPAGSEYGQSFVRIRPFTFPDGVSVTPVHITAIDDAGSIGGRFTIELEYGHSFHFNSNDITDGNAAKGIEGIGQPSTGNWRLHVEAPDAGLEVLSYVRTPDGFLTAMHDRVVIYHRGTGFVETFNPASNTRQQSRLRVINPSPVHSAEVSIEGYDDDDGYGSLRFVLPAGHSRTLTAIDLEEGAAGLTGSLGDGAGKWALRIVNLGEGTDYTPENPIVVQNLLYASSGHISNLSTLGALSEWDIGDHAETAVVFSLNVNDGLGFSRLTTLPTGDTDWFKYTFSESGRFDFAVLTFGNDRATATLYDGDLATILEFSSGVINRREVRSGDDYFLQVRPEGELEFGFGITSGIFVPNTDHHGDTREDATNVDICEDCEEAGDDTHWGAINAAGDVDWFRIHLVDGLADDTLFFRGGASYFSGGEDEALPSLIGTLYDSAGNELASDAPNDGTFNIRYTVAEERTYYLSVQSDAATEKLAYGVTMGYD